MDNEFQKLIWNKKERGNAAVPQSGYEETLAVLFQIAKTFDQPFVARCMDILRKPLFQTPSADHEPPASAGMIMKALRDVLTSHEFVNGCDSVRPFVFYLVCCRILGKPPSDAQASDCLYNGGYSSGFHMHVSRANAAFAKYYRLSQGSLVFSLYKENGSGYAARWSESAKDSVFTADCYRSYCASNPSAGTIQMKKEELHQPPLNSWPGVVRCLGSLVAAHVDNTQSLDSILILAMDDSVSPDSLAIHLAQSLPVFTNVALPGNIHIEGQHQRGRITATKQLYLSIDCNEMYAGPTRSEPIRSVWALAEHLSRLSCDQTPADFFSHLSFEPIQELFGDGGWHRVDSVVLIYDGVKHPSAYSATRFAEDFPVAFKSSVAGPKTDEAKALNIRLAHWMPTVRRRAFHVCLPAHGFITDNAYKVAADWICRELELL